MTEVLLWRSLNDTLGDEPCTDSSVVHGEVGRVRFPSAQKKGMQKTAMAGQSGGPDSAPPNAMPQGLVVEFKQLS